MTIRLLRPFNGIPAGANVQLDAATEAALISSLSASADLSGGFDWQPNSPYDITAFDGRGSRAEDFGAFASADSVRNHGALQRALNQKGLVTLKAPGRYYLSESLVIGSDTTLELGDGVELYLANLTRKNVLVNAAYQRARAAVMAITASGYTATVTQIAHGYSVGDWIWIAGATAGGYNGVFQVVTVPTANTYTVRLPYAPSVTTATGTITACLADVNIAVRGGEVNYNGTNNTSNNTPAMHTFIFSGVRNLDVHSILMSDAVKYSVMLGAVADFRVRDLTFQNTIAGSDGVHMNGPCFRGVVERLFGVTGDDFCSLTIGDYSNWEVSRGDYKDIVCRDLYPTYCPNNVTKLAGNTPFRFDDITFENIGGRADLTAVNIIDDTNLVGTTCGHVRIRNVTTSNQGNYPAIELRAAAGSVDFLDIDGITWDNISGHVLLLNAGNTTCVRIRNVVNKDKTKHTAGYAIVYADEGTHGLVDIDCDITIAAHRAFSMDSFAVGATVSRLLVSGRIVGDGSANSAAVWHDVGTISQLVLHDLQTRSLDRVYKQQSASPNVGIDVLVSDVASDTTARFIEIQKGGTITLSGVRLTNQTNTPIRGFGTDAIRIEGSMQVTGSATTDYAHGTGTPPVNFKGNLRVDGSIVAAAAGDQFWNTNAAFGAPGVGLYGRTAAGAWTRVF